LICTVLGYTRQAYYKQEVTHKKQKKVKEHITMMVCQQRKMLPKVGGKKLYLLMKEHLCQAEIKCGRDKLFTVLRENDLLIPPRKRYIQTTMSKHWMRKYPNLVKEQRPTAPEHIWVSDITYIATEEGYCYLSLVTDAYSRKIMGYHVSDSLDAEQSRKAFQMALRNRTLTTPLIHHSDRGLQYCSKEYVELAEKNNVRMSMTEHSDPYENALAERMNRTMKEEFALGSKLPSKDIAVHVVREAVELYNTYRPHWALNGLTPQSVHEKPR
jgi:transposase InsO family protein